MNHNFTYLFFEIIFQDHCSHQERPLSSPSPQYNSAGRTARLTLWCGGLQSGHCLGVQAGLGEKQGREGGLLNFDSGD